MQCHLETTSFPFPHSILKYDRAPFSYRPGEALSDFLLYFDHAPTRPDKDRFQIVNSVYRLRMSACFLKSGGALQCTTCHDPHGAPRGEAAARHYQEVCRQCHGAALNARVAAARHTDSTACIECHMPKRRTGDVVHVVMTDHYIQRRRAARDLLAEMPEPNGPETLYRGEVLAYYPSPSERTHENDLYLALAQVRNNNNPDRGIPRLRAAIDRLHPARGEFYVELGDALRRVGKSRQAVPWYEEGVRRSPALLAGWTGLGQALDLSGQFPRALETFERATRLAPSDALSWQELGQVSLKLGRNLEAISALQKSIELDGSVPEAHYALGAALAAPGGDAARAEASFREAIRLQPDYEQAHLNLAIVLSQRGRQEEARYHFEIALRLRPDYALAHLNFGLMLRGSGRGEQAAEHFREAAKGSDPAVRERARRALQER